MNFHYSTYDNFIGKGTWYCARHNQDIENVPYNIEKLVAWRYCPVCGEEL